MGALKRSFEAEIQSSKSLFNRALIAQSFFPNFVVKGHADCADVVDLAQALQMFQKDRSQEGYHVGNGGTTLRFLVSRLSRASGTFLIQGDRRLLERPHHGLWSALEGLGVQVEATGEVTLRLQSQGWKVPDLLTVDSRDSSQYLSALLLSAWELPKDLVIQHNGDVASLSYLQMTIDLLSLLGMEIQQSDGGLRIPKGQRVQVDSYSVEPDMSSCFTIACFGALLGTSKLYGVPSSSLQPDFLGLKILKEMGAVVEHGSSILEVKRARQLQGGQWDLKNNPDLFPVLAVTLAQASGASLITGIENLVHKESNRVVQTTLLLEAMGVRSSYDGHGFRIEGDCVSPDRARSEGPNYKILNPDQDHRMAMAITLAIHCGFPFRLETPDVVRKSFPNFYEIVGHA